MRAETPARRRSASSSPNTASPKRLIFRRSPLRVRRFSDLVRRLSLASIIRCPIRVLSAHRAIGTTSVGNMGAKKPPTLIRNVRTPGKKSGTSRESSRKFRPATRRSSGRATRSTKPSAKAGPSGSLSTPARRSEDASGLRCKRSARSSHARTNTTTSSPSVWAPATPVGFFVVTTFSRTTEDMSSSVRGEGALMHIQEKPPTTGAQCPRVESGFPQNLATDASWAHHVPFLPCAASVKGGHHQNQPPHESQDPQEN